jgi:hypothetical protein
MKKYYFVAYAWRNTSMSDYRYANKCLDIHPLEWLKKSYEYDEHISIISYHEISEEIFDIYCDEF